MKEMMEHISGAFTPNSDLTGYDNPLDSKLAHFQDIILTFITTRMRNPRLCNRRSCDNLRASTTLAMGLWFMNTS